MSRTVLLAAVLVTSSVTAAGAVAATAPTRTAGELAVALSLPAPGFQVGSVRGAQVVYARGLEVDVARVLARRLGLARVRLVHVRNEARLLAGGAKRWDVSLAQLVPTPRARGVAFSVPYLPAGQAVLAARGVPRPRGLTALRHLVVCAVRRTPGAAFLAQRLGTSRRLLAGGLGELLRWTQTGRCEAAVADLPALAARLRGSGGRYGRVVGAIDTGEALAVALPAGSPLLADVNRALTRLRRDGTLRRIALRWLAFDPARLRVLARAR
jgi:glutamine transport system substrate-binding protein